MPGRRPYLDSAHGNSSYGVNRSTATCENWPDGVCSTGSCAHCHDTFDPNICENDLYGLMLFAPNDNPTSQTDNFCFQCHKGDSYVQVGIINNTFSTNFGGGAATFTTIYDAFNPATGDTPSSHNLADIQDFVAGYYGFTTETNACVVCHNHHAAQQNYPVTLSGMGGVRSAIRRVIDHESLAADLWGDEDFATSDRYELTNDFFEAYGFSYQAPYYGDTSDPDWELSYEPAGNNTLDGSNLPNIISFCLDCHSHENVTSTERGINLQKIYLPDNQHGTRHEDGANGYTLPPYGDNGKNYVLSCTDCHETHGSQNEWLLRTCVNGKDGITIPATGKGKWWDFCTACHVLTNGTDSYHKPVPTSPVGCPDCHYHGHVDF